MGILQETYTTEKILLKLTQACRILSYPYNILFYSYSNLAETNKHLKILFYAV